MNRSLFAVILVSGLLVGSCGSADTASTSPPLAPVQRPSLDAIQKAIPAKAATVAETHQGTRGAPIVVIEEAHSSRAGQGEVALILAALHEAAGLKHIVLEGYLKEDAPIPASALLNLPGAPTPFARARLVSEMLHSGDISGAEFMRLVYDDVQLLPAETTSEYSSDQNIDAMVVLPLYIGQIALESLDPGGQAKAEGYAQKIGLSASTPDDKKLERILKFSDYVISLDPWSTDVMSKLKDEDQFGSIEQEISILEGVIERAKTQHVSVPAQYRDIMAKYVAFLSKRAAASQTIVRTTTDIADHPQTPIVAVNIGAGHTAAVRKLLADQGRSYVVVSLNSLHDKAARNDMSFEELDRKYQMQPVTGGVVGQTLAGAFDLKVRGQNKPKPVVQQEWFKAKEELYKTIDTLTSMVNTRAAGGGGGKPPKPPRPGAAAGGAGGEPPNRGPDGSPLNWFIGSNDERMRQLRSNSLASVQTDAIEVLPDERGVPTYVLFPVVLNPNDAVHRKTVWIKARRVAGLDPDKSPKTVEELLEMNLDQLAAERKAKKPSSDTRPEKAEKVSRFQVSFDVKAVAALNREDAVRATLRY